MLIMPHHFEIYRAFLANLEASGYNVTFYFSTGRPFRYESVLQRMKNFVRKTIFSDKSYKQKLVSDFDDRRLQRVLQKDTSRADYALVIRPDLLSQKSLLMLKSRCIKFVGYQWDGIDRYPKVKSVIHVFDKFFVFDADDYQKYQFVYGNIFVTTNFYFDFVKSEQISVGQKTVFFIGSFIESRIDDIIHLTNVFRNLGYILNVNLLYFDPETPRKYVNEGINFIKEPLTYLEVLENIKEAEIVLDFVDSVHNGLSFRLFEALYFSKKIVTNNRLVKANDFYSEQNILVWEKTVSAEEISQFLSSGYTKIDDDIIKRHSFSHWIKNMFE